MTTWMYRFDHDHAIEGNDLKKLVGGKGAGLAAMTKLGIPVPPGFTIPTSACLAYLRDGWGPELTSAVRAGITGIEQAVGRRLGDPAAPLVVSVRSGAELSMPGMMDTVLNTGMTVEVARGLAALSGDEGFAWDTYRRAIVSFAQVVLGAPSAELAELATLADDGTAHESTAHHGAVHDGTADERAALAFAARVGDAGCEIPADPLAQIEAAVEAVFRSWRSDRAAAYRTREGISHDLGTAATVQAMVFGNMGDRSGTGVAFSRCPSTGEPGLMGDFLAGAQGEDVVAGTHNTMPLSDLADRWPDVWEQLNQVATKLELQSADMVDLEFTVEDGRLWLLQTRIAKRSPAAVFRTAVQMANEADFPVDRAEAVRRCAKHMDNPPQLPATSDDDDDAVVIATGLAASPGRTVGVVSLDPDDAVEREGRGEQVILVRSETSPADIHGMSASVGLVTSLGGMVSHAAVVARSWGLAAVVGCEGISLTGDAIVTGDRRIEPGTVVTVDGDGGRVLLGEWRAGSAPLPEVETIRTWARAADEVADESTSGSSAAIVGDVVDPETCLRVLALKGMANAEGLTEALGATEQPIVDALATLEHEGLAAELKAGRMRPTPEGLARVDELISGEREQHQQLCDAALDRFHEPNMLLKEVVTAWQVRVVDGQEVMNDHTDEAYDAGVLTRLRNEVHNRVTPIVAEVAAALPRMGRYRERLDAALVKLAANDHRYIAHPMLDSYHTVWFEFHEELIRLAGRDRASEAAAGRA